MKKLKEIIKNWKNKTKGKFMNLTNANVEEYLLNKKFQKE